VIEEDNADQESMVLDASDSSGSSVNMLDMVLYGHNPPQDHNILQVGMMQHMIGPVLPPEMQWCKLFETMMPLLMTKDIPLSLKSVSFNWVKRSWTAAFDDNAAWKIQLGTVGDQRQLLNRKVIQVKRKVARVLDFEDQPAAADILQSTEFSATPSTPKKKRSRKVRAPLVQPAERRFTRSALKSNGYKPKAVMDVEPKKKKPSRAKMLVVNEIHSEQENAEGDLDHGQEEEIPVTPIVVMQNVGLALGIPPEKLTKEQLEVGPSNATKSKLANE
jgi:hypothetical protein